MPLYHFHLESSGAGSTGDADRRELTDDARAIQEAGSSAGEVLLDELTSGLPQPRVVVTVERSDGTKVAVIKAYAEVQTFPVVQPAAEPATCSGKTDEERRHRAR